MKIINFNLKNVVVVIIIDPINVQDISIDALKGKGYNKIVIDPNVIIFKNSKGLGTAFFQSARLEFNSGEVKTFQSEKFVNFIMGTLAVIPKGIPKFLGINYFAKANVENEKDISQYIKRNLLSDGSKLDEKLGAPILSAATRIVFGKPDDNLDIRIFPFKFDDPNLGIQFHSHKIVTDNQNIKVDLKKRLDTELSLFLNKLTVL